MLGGKLIRLAGALTVAGLMAGAPLRAGAQTTLEMAYMPIVPCSQLFVMEGMGWTKKAGIKLKLTRFSSGPAIVQAIASGKMDVMCFGIGPALRRISLNRVQCGPRGCKRPPLSNFR